jgi:hypothetical protein
MVDVLLIFGTANVPRRDVDAKWKRASRDVGGAELGEQDPNLPNFPLLLLSAFWTLGYRPLETTDLTAGVQAMMIAKWFSIDEAKSERP